VHERRVGRARASGAGASSAPLTFAATSPVPIMFVLRLILGAAAVVMLHAALFTQPPAGARERARRRR
jgi:hypothetical protein